MRTINRVVLFEVLRAVHIGSVDPAFLRRHPGYHYGFLERGALLHRASHAEYDMSPEFVERALEKGDECFGILDGATLASYGWYAKTPTAISDDLWLHFDRRYVYMYKGFTHPRYRGQRLHATGMTLALETYLNRGFDGLVSYVESNNLDSLKSVRRMGYRDFGRIYVLRFLDRYLIRSTRGCGKYGFRLEQRRESRRSATGTVRSLPTPKP
jgi:ribosomal protein S18 acetylase RimI-like enzyme